MPASERALPILSFESPPMWDRWLTAQSVKSKGLWLKLAKQSAGVASVSKQEAVETALCHGWIDGQLDKFDDHYWLVRFTPRGDRSKWSEKNRTTALELIEQGRMKPAGLREIEQARKDGRWDGAYAPQSAATVPEDLGAALTRNRKARSFFETLDSANRYAILHRVHEARRPETRTRRIEKYVAMLSRGETIHPPKKKR